MNEQTGMKVEYLEAAAQLWRPVLVRATVALVFGVLTVFWTKPDTSALAVTAGLYFVSSGISSLWLAVRSTLGPPSVQLLARVVPAVLLALTGAVGFLVPSDAYFGLAGAIALMLFGAAELGLAIFRRGQFVLARDWLITGFLTLATGAALPFFIPLGAHALLGVMGGGAIMVGVVLALSGLSLRHDAAAPTKDVN